MKSTTFQKIVNAVVVDDELTDKQKYIILDSIREKYRINDYEWYKIYNVYCVTCIKQLNEKPLKFIQARRLQLLHKKKRETYDSHSGSFSHGVELREIKKRKNKQ